MPQLLPTTAMILSAGLGTRMGALSNYYPKPLLPVLGVPIIEHSIIALRNAGVRRFVVNLFHRGAQLRAHLEGRAMDLGVSFAFVEEPILLGTGGGVKNAEPLLGSEPFWLLNGDVLIEVDLPAVWAFHQEKKGDATLVLRQPSVHESYGKLSLGKDKKISGILDTGIHTSSPLMFTGLQIVEPRFLKHLSVEPSCIIRQGYVPHFERDLALYGYELGAGKWYDVGTAERLYWVNRELLSEIRSGKRVKPVDYDVSSSSVVMDRGVLSRATVAESIVGEGVSCTQGNASIRRAVVFSAASVGGVVEQGLFWADQELRFGEE